MAAMPQPYRRHDGRKVDELRPLRITPGYLGSADGSCLFEMGRTRLICTACIVPEVPKWRQEAGLGWVTAEYGMLPASTGRRKARPLEKPDSRATEIQRLIGRVLRSVVRFERLGTHTIYLDCDVLEADGGTRTAAINGACIALALAARKGEADGRFARGVLTGLVSGVSVGVVQGTPVLDLDYREDSAAEVDMNVALTAGGKFVELQGTAEGAPFTTAQLDRMLALARKGARRIAQEQKRTLAGSPQP